MPELPEVETTLRGVSPLICKQKIKQLNIHNPNMRWPVDTSLPSKLRNKTVLGTERRAKYLLIHVESGSLILHLGMSGNLSIVDKQTPLKKHDHFEIEFENGKVLRLHDPRRFGAVLWTSQPWQQHSLIKTLGPEPLSEDFTAEYLHKKSRKRSIAIKSFIMDSHIVVGVGNIYASESLFEAGIHPMLAAGKVSLNRCTGLVEAIKTVLQKAIAQGGTTLKDFSSPDGKPGYFVQQLNVYQRKDLPCPKCSHPIKHRTINQRATFYCTRCQK